jgi:hypothetical protein
MPDCQTHLIKVTITVNPRPDPPVIDGPKEVAVEPQMVGQEFSVPVARVLGGLQPYMAPSVSSISPDKLPAGIYASIDASGVISLSGVPETPGTKVVILEVHDSPH